MNQTIILTGRVGQQPETKGEMATLSLATSTKFTNRAGEKVEETEWWNLTAYGNTAGFIEKWIHKGDLIQVHCRRKTVKKDDRTFYNYIVDRLIPLSSTAKKQEEAAPTRETTPAQATKEEEFEDFPF